MPKNKKENRGTLLFPYYSSFYVVLFKKPLPVQDSLVFPKKSFFDLGYLVFDVLTPSFFQVLVYDFLQYFVYLKVYTCPE